MDVQMLDQSIFHNVPYTLRLSTLLCLYLSTQGLKVEICPRFGQL